MSSEAKLPDPDEVVKTTSSTKTEKETSKSSTKKSSTEGKKYDGGPIPRN